MPYAHINGVRLYYERRGVGPPVVYLHGGFPSLSMHLRSRKAITWERAFAQACDFVWYDRRVTTA